MADMFDFGTVADTYSLCRHTTREIWVPWTSARISTYAGRARVKGKIVLEYDSDSTFSVNNIGKTHGAYSRHSCGDVLDHGQAADYVVDFNLSLPKLFAWCDRCMSRAWSKIFRYCTDPSRPEMILCPFPATFLHKCSGRVCHAI